jgi:protein gp37
MAECLAHSYWNLLSDVIHAEIVLLTRKEVFWAMMPTPHGTFTVGTKVFSS